MLITKMTEALKESVYFNRLLPAGDHVICMYLSGRALIDNDYNDRYDIVIVTGHTTDLNPDEMLIYHNKKIRWIYLSLAMFTTYKEYFKYNYLPTYGYKDLFLYSICFVNDSKIFYVNPNYTMELTKLYAVRKNTNIKKFIRYCYQYNEELIDTFNSDNIKPIKDCLYHFLIMSYIINNETLTQDVIDNVKRIQTLVDDDTDLSITDKQFINDRFSLLRTLCK